MFEVKVRSHLFIAHSLKHQSFGKAANLHGATYVVDLIIAADSLEDNNVVIDIEIASDVLKKCLDKYNFKNLDDIDELSAEITTTEFIARTLVQDFISSLDNSNLIKPHIKSIKAILNESHIASASYEQKVN